MTELWHWEDKNPAVFASPRALAAASLIAELDRLKHVRHPGSGERAVPRAARQATAD